MILQRNVDNFRPLHQLLLLFLLLGVNERYGKK